MLIKEIINKFDKSNIKAGDGCTKGRYPLYTCSPIVNKYLDNYLYDDEALILSTGGNFSIHYVNGKFNYSTDCYVFNTNKYNLKYIYYYLISREEDINKMFRGAGLKHLNKNEFLLLDIQEKNSEEQVKIVNTLDSITELISIKKGEIEKCDNLIKSQFVEMLYLNPSANKLGEFISRYKAERANDIDYPVLSITKEFGIVLQSEKFKKRIASDDTSSYKVVPYGKLVQGIHIDERNFAIQNKVDNGIVSPAYKIWNVDETKCNSEVLAYALRSDYVMNYIRSKFTGSIKRRENINYEDFMATPINLPKLEIQNEFYEKKKLIDKQKFEFEQSLKKLEELKSSLMQEYFG